MNGAQVISILWKTSVLLMALPLWIAAARGSEVDAVLVGPAEPVAAGSRASVWLHYLNGSGREMSRSFPRTLVGRLVAGEPAATVSLELRDPGDAGNVTIPPGGFVRREYVLAIPESLRGSATLFCPALDANRVVLDLWPAEPGAQAKPSAAGKSGLARWLQEAEPEVAESGPMRFFKQHFFGYEPFYFIAGPDSPNAKFQISLRYQLLNHEGSLARKVPPLEGLNVAYTQTSLWDWNAPSAPFFDSSYKPELLYLWQRVDRGRWANWFRLDLQAGFQHESNGKADADSRSLNIAYLRPTLILGRKDSLQATLAPRVWIYVGDLSDNPELKDYRGYADLRATVGWARGLQLGASGRLGDDADHGSLQFDLTYPMMHLLSGSFSLYLQAQYFTGYGESLLLYNQRSDAFRVGFALYR